MYERKTKDIYNLIYCGEVIDQFETFKEAKEMKKEYEFAFKSYISIQKKRVSK